MAASPLIQELFKTLPPPDTEWSIAERVKWLQAAAAIFDLLYSDDSDASKIDVRIESVGSVDDMNP